RRFRGGVPRIQLRGRRLWTSGSLKNGWRNTSLPENAVWRCQSATHGGETLSEFQAIALSHMGKASSDIRYNPEAGPEAYSNPMAHTRLATHTEMGKEKYGPDWDLSANPIDGDIVMRMGGGKKHGRYALGDSTLDPATTPTLSQIRAGSANPDIRQAPTAAHVLVQTLQ
ncbi:unnamed protein product, partial [Urochloa humidicola]